MQIVFVKSFLRPRRDFFTVFPTPHLVLKTRTSGVVRGVLGKALCSKNFSSSGPVSEKNPTFHLIVKEPVQKFSQNWREK